MSKIILTTGVFDLGMHVGHFMLLLQCRKLAGTEGKVIVGVNTDFSAEKYKRKPVFDQHERMYYMEQLPFINTTVFINSEDDIERIIIDERVDYYIKSAEWADHDVTGEKLCDVLFVKPVPSFHGRKLSTSQIITSVYDYKRVDSSDNPKAANDSGDR